MNTTPQSIDRIRRARKTGAEMMADLERIPYVIDPHRDVNPEQYPNGADADNPYGGYGSVPYDMKESAYDGMGDYEADARSQMEDGSESAYRQHRALTDMQNASVEDRMLTPDGVTPLEMDDFRRGETGLSRQDYQAAGGMSGQERMAAMAEEQSGASQARFDGPSYAARREQTRLAHEAERKRMSDARRHKVIEDESEQRWLETKSERLAAAEAGRAATGRMRAEETRQRNSDSFDATMEGKIAEDLTLPMNNEVIIDPRARHQEREGPFETQDMLDREARDLQAMDELPTESQPNEAPLPGEETFPPAVAAWAQRRADRGQGGLKALREAYYREIPEDARSGSDIHSFEGWLVRKGIKPDMSAQEAIPILNRIAPMDAKHLDRRRDEFVATFMSRYAEQMAQRGITEQDIYSVYDSGVKSDKNGDPIMAGTNAVNSRFRGNLKARKAQEIQLAVQKRGDQFNRSRQFGVPVGGIQFFDSLQAAKTPQERANLLMLAHRAQPAMGWDRMAAMLMKGEIDNNALSQWAERSGGNAQQSGLDRIGTDAATITSNWGKPGWKAQARQHAISIRGQGAKPADIDNDIAQIGLNGARAAILSGRPLTPEEKVSAQEVLDRSSIAAFARQLGLKEDDPRLPRMYYAVFDSAPSPSFWGAPGRFAATVANGVLGLINPPTAAASPAPGPTGD